MATQRALRPAKFGSPRLHQTLPRERLFDWLDRHLPRAGIWVCGEPGAGKTTLVASYLSSRSHKHLWYRLDADDNDIGRFFSMLGEAAATLGVKLKLPPFAAEHLAQPAAFARPWLRRFFTALPRPLLLVLDNLEQAALPWLPQLLATAVAEAPEGVTLLLTSRHRPPPELAAAVVADTLAVLGAEQLRFSPDEAASYARQLGLDERSVCAAALSVNGWAAGLRLLSHASAAAGPEGSSQQLLFDYFAGLLHDSLDARGQHLLQVAALLPWIAGEVVAELAGVPDAVQRLERLCADNLFTERVGSAPVLYRLHPLFRDFLRERGRRALSGDVRAHLLSRAAHAFVALDQHDAAIDLALDGADHALACTLWLSVLEGKLASGQVDQLDAWYRRLPAELAQTLPQVQYGRARVCFLREEAAAPAHYERALAAFERAGDLQGQQLCAAGLLEWIYNSDSFAGHQRWSDVMAREGAAAPALEVHALRLLNGHLLAWFYSGRVEAADWTERVLALLTPGPCENEKLLVAITLLGCLERAKRWPEAQALAERMEGLLLSAVNIGPRLKILVRQQIAADLYRQTGEYGQARRLALVALAEADEHRFEVLGFEALAILLLAALYMGDAAETERLFGELAQRTVPGNVYHQRFMRQMRGWQALQGGRLTSAREHADALRDAVRRSDMPAGFRATWLLVAVYARFAEGQEQEACDELAQLCDQAEAGSRETLQANLASLQAHRHLRAGQLERAAQELAPAWAACAAMRYFQLLAPLRQALAELAAFALERGFAVDFTRSLIERRRLVAPTPAALHWPWPLRITTLGRFAIELDGQPLAFAGKVPKKPLALLKALVAMGGHAVAQHRLSDALWPDDDADAAQDAFSVALHRLRKVLGPAGAAIDLHDGCLSLDPQRCWTDVQAFERLVGAGKLQQALALYAGHFLAADADEPWSVSMRERLRGRFNVALHQVASALAAAGEHEQALACWRQGLEIDDLNEPYYQGVMHCALQLQRPAEGLAAYQRLRRMLSIVLGVAPSDRSEALHRQLRA